MYAGTMTERIGLYRPRVSTDAFGAETTAYELVRFVHAVAEWKSGGISQEAGEFFPDAKMNFLIRDAHEVVAGWRVSFQDMTWGVDAVQHSRTRGFRRLYCSRINE